MKYVITAIGNKKINEELKKYNNMQVVAQDIQYKEGIIEFLEIEKNRDINFIILSELLPGKIKIESLLENIMLLNHKIEIIMILEKENKELENYLNKINIKKVFYNNKLEISDLINIINENNQNEIEEEIKKLKEIILEKRKYNKKIKFNNFNFFRKKEKIKKEELNKIKDPKIISILGGNGVGKSIITSNIAKCLENNIGKILIIDFDILNNSIHTLFGVNKYSKKIKEKINKRKKEIEKNQKNFLKNVNIKNSKIIENYYMEINKNNKDNNSFENYDFDFKDFIIKVNKKIDLICGIDILFKNKNEINKEKIKSIISEFKNKYEIILIDTSSECFFEYNRIIIENSDLSIFLIEPNLIEVKKSRNLLDIYINNWNINKEKIKIIYNKINGNSIDDKIINFLFSEFKLLGKIKYNKKYNLLINKNINIIFDLKIKKEYKKIINKLFEKKGD